MEITPFNNGIWKNQSNGINSSLFEVNSNILVIKANIVCMT